MLLSGCAMFYGSESQRNNNRQRLGLLHVGLTKEDVIQKMGAEGSKWCHDSFFGWCYRSETFGNPYRTAGFEVQGKHYLILYYYTDVKKLDDVLTDDELTPLIFEGDKLIGWGQDLLEGTLKKYEIRLR
jgi:hypothetical protein